MFIVIRNSCEGETGVGFIANSNEFTSFIENLNSELGAKYIKGRPISDFKETDEFSDGFYIIDGSDESEIMLINKYRVLTKRFFSFYTSTQIKTEVVSKWKFIPFDNKEKKVIDVAKIGSEEYQFEENSYFNDSNDKDKKEKEQSNICNERTFLEYELFDINDIKARTDIENNNLIGIIGNRGSGKSTIVNSFLKKQNPESLKNTLIVTSSKENIFKNDYPTVTIINNLNNKIIRDFLNKTSGSIIIDDMIIPKKTRGTIWETILFENSGKLKIILSQNDTVLHPRAKKRMDYVFYLGTKNETSIDKIFHNFGRFTFNSLASFTDIFGQITDNYGAIVFKKDINEYKIYRYNSSI